MAKPIHAFIVPGLVRKFEQLVDRSAPEGCHLFLGDRGDRGGYGRLKYHGRLFSAHRLSLTLKLGRDIAPGMQAQHLCDTPGCVNEKHLIEGSPAINALHACIGRVHVHGERNGNSKLTDSTAAQAWARIAQGEPDEAIAADMGLSRATIQDLRLGRSWTHVTGITRQRTHPVPLPRHILASMCKARDQGALLHEIASEHRVNIKTVRNVLRGEGMLPTPTPNADGHGQGHAHPHPAPHMPSMMVTDTGRGDADQNAQDNPQGGGNPHTLSTQLSPSAPHTRSLNAHDAQHEGDAR